MYSSKNGVLLETSPSFTKKNMFYDEIDDFLKSAVNGVKNRANIDQVMVTSEVMDAIYKSAEQGKEIQL
ncbi:hypothetical protein D3C71_2100220 [compost metagenome]